MKSSLAACSGASFLPVIAPLSLGLGSLAATGCNGSAESESGVAGHGAAAGSGGSSASGGTGGSTDTVTHDCPDGEISGTTPCYDDGLTCGYQELTHCDQGGTYWVCNAKSGFFQYAHADTLPCQCPEALPADGDACDPFIVNYKCKYTVTLDCGDVEVVATCTPYSGPDNTWSVPTAVCP